MFRFHKGWYVAALLAGGMFINNAIADENKQKGDKEPPKSQPTKGEPTKGEPSKGEPNKPVGPIIIQIDGSKLPPELLKKLLELSQQQPNKPTFQKEEPKKGEPSKQPTKEEPKKGEPAKPNTKKAISLSDAIAIAEKLTKGTAKSAEQEDDGFEVELVDGQGKKVKVELDLAGNVKKNEQKGEKKKDEDEKKGEKKKEEEKKGEKKKEKD